MEIVTKTTILLNWKKKTEKHFFITIDVILKIKE